MPANGCSQTASQAPIEPRLQFIQVRYHDLLRCSFCMHLSRIDLVAFMQTFFDLLTCLLSVTPLSCHLLTYPHLAW